MIALSLDATTYLPNTNIYLTQQSNMSLEMGPHKIRISKSNTEPKPTLCTAITHQRASIYHCGTVDNVDYGYILPCYLAKLYSDPTQQITEHDRLSR